MQKNLCFCGEKFLTLFILEYINNKNKENWYYMFQWSVFLYLGEKRVHVYLYLFFKK